MATVMRQMILPCMLRAWGELRPPLSDTRWVCFPYLSELPASVLDLPARIAVGDIKMMMPTDSMMNLTPVAPIPEAVWPHPLSHSEPRPHRAETPCEQSAAMHGRKQRAQMHL